jgi:transmembrane sensor
MTSLNTLLQSVAREEDEFCACSPARHRVRERLLRRHSGQTPARRRYLVVPLALAAAMAMAVGFNHLRKSSSNTRLVARDLHGAIVEGSWVSALRGEEHPLRFSDGSTIALSPLSQARLVQLRSNGADIFLEAGLANVAVIHQPKAQWKIAAGPFTVNVTGTRFDISWSPVQDRFELRLAEGNVIVSGCGFGNGRAINAGQHVLGSCKTGLAEVTRSPLPASPDDATGSVDETTAACSPPEPSRSQDCTRTSPSATSSARSVDTKRRKPSSSSDPMDLEHASASELLNSGNLVRHEGNLARAKSILGALRRRFPGSNEAGQAAFSLGLIDFDGFGAHASAANWFRIYLAEQPSGTLVREARGRLMEALYRSSSPEAQAAAEAYLTESPSGPHSELARRILKQQ